MLIRHIGHSLLHTPVCAFHLRNILHAPQATNHLLYVHHFTHDNNAFFEFHPCHFLIKYTPTRTPLPHGRCVGGLYPLSFHGVKHLLSAFLATRPSFETWHQRLGHPGVTTLQHVISQHHLVTSSNKHSNICNARQIVKSCQLPFPDSSNKASAPLELIHTDV
jgi:hypothetical protein